MYYQHMKNDTERDYDVILSGTQKHNIVKLWNKGIAFETEAIEQLQRVSRLPFIYKWIAAMPDTHAGKGATIGSVIATTGAVIPAAVGSDLGCGIQACRISKSKTELGDVAKLRHALESKIPHGRTDNGGENDRGAWHDVPDVVENAWEEHLRAEYEELCIYHPQLKKANAKKHIASLGSGNHYFECVEDENNKVWLVVHSGSRGIGSKIGSYFTQLAKEQCEKWFITLEDKELSYFPEGTEYFNDYIFAANWAQKFARINRDLMISAALKVIDDISLETIDCHHNFVERENHFGRNVLVTRKGAVRARVGDMCIIPGSMGTNTYICEGKGNPESFCSCSHGAGRTMSRTKARNTFTLEDHVLATAGVECRKDESVLDETPGAYKNIDAVMNAQESLVRKVHTLKQFMCIKG